MCLLLLAVILLHKSDSNLFTAYICLSVINNQNIAHLIPIVCGENAMAFIAIDMRASFFWGGVLFFDLWILTDVLLMSTHSTVYVCV